MTTTQWVLFGFFCDEQFWCQVYNFRDILLLVFYHLSCKPHLHNLHITRTLYLLSEKTYSIKENVILMLQ